MDRMNGRDDAGLRGLFSELREADRRAGVPSFEATLEAVRRIGAARPRGRLPTAFSAPALRIAAAAVLLVGVGYVVLKPRSYRPGTTTSTYRIASWRAPTDTLLNLPMLNTFNGYAGVTESVLDLGTTTRDTTTKTSQTRSTGDTI